MNSSRREFHKLVGAGAAMGFCAGCAGGGGGGGLGGQPDVVTLSAPVNSQLTLALSTQPALANTNGSAVVVRSPGVEDILVVHWTDGRWAAMSDTCTHAGCPVEFDGSVVGCPCHGSEFNIDGSVLRGPARTPLRSYPVTVDGNNNLVINVA